MADLFGVDLKNFFSDHIEDAVTEITFPSKADQLDEKDLESIAAFRKMINNYQRVTKPGNNDT